MATRSKRWQLLWRIPLYAVLGSLALLCALVASLHTQLVREQVRLRVNGVLAGVFQGRVVIDRIGSLGLSGASGVDARVLDAAGHQVLAVRGVRCAVWLPGLGLAFALHPSRPVLLISRVEVDDADVTLREDPDAGVTLASAFLPRETAETRAPTDPDAGPRLHIASIELGRVWAHGRASGSPPLDVEVTRLTASLSQSPRDGFQFELHRATLLTRALTLSIDPRGRVSGRVEVPPDGAGPLRLEAALDGSAAGSPLSAEISWVGDALHARLDLLRVPAKFLNEQVPSLALDGDVTVSVDVDGALPELDFTAELDASAAHVTAVGYAMVSGGLELVATLNAARVDLSRAVDGAPPSELDVSASAVLFERDDGLLVGSERIDLAPGRIAGQLTPALWITGRSELDSERGTFAHGRLGASEQGASLAGGYEVRLPATGSRLVAVTASAALDDPPRLARFGTRAAGHVALSGELRPDSGAVAAKALVQLSHLDQAPISARSVELRASVSGTLTSPRVHAAALLDLLSGRVHADWDYTRARETLDAFAVDIDAVRAAHLLGAKLPVRGGVLDLDAHLVRTAPLAPYRLDASARGNFGSLGSLSLAARNFELPRALSRRSLGRLEGELEARGQIDLESASPLLIAAGAPIDRASGTLRFELTSGKASGESGRVLAAALDTYGLRVVQARPARSAIENTAEAIAAQPRALEGIDVHVSTHAWLDSGQLAATAIVRDTGGTLLEAQASTDISSLLARGSVDVAALPTHPLRVSIDVPERRIGKLPPLIRPAALRGRVSGHAELSGSLRAPSADVEFWARSLRGAGTKKGIDIAGALHYEPRGGQAQMMARSESAEVASALVAWQGDLERAVRLDSSDGVIGSAAIKFDDFPLNVAPELTERQIDGRLNGEISLANWGKDATLSAELSSDDLLLGSVRLQRLLVEAQAGADRASAKVSLRAGRGSADGMLDADIRWGAQAIPTLLHRGSASLDARAFELESLSPLLGAYVSELGGSLDAHTRLDVSPDSTRLSGTAVVRRGVVQIPAIGQRLSDIDARVTVRDDRVELEQLVASGVTGRLSATGNARLDGFALRAAEASVAIKESEPLPLTIEGAALGDAWGNLRARYESPEAGERRLDVDVPDFHLLTPEASPHGLQSLDPPESIRVGVRRGDGQFAALPVQPLTAAAEDESTSNAPVQPLRIRVKLGRNVTVERDRSAKAQLTGEVTIVSASTTTVDGRIELKGGKLDVSGKTFEIERGVITFQGDDPSNPTITATARWDAPGYTVYADYLGDVKNGRIKLHAEPPLTQDEIASLLLFGSPEGSVGSSGAGSGAALAVSVAGDQAVRGLNQALDEFTSLNVSARVDTTTGAPRPELVFQVSPRVAAKVTRAIGAPAAGESPDRTFLTLELRLKRSWGLSALIGDRGASALDLIWRRRY